MSRYPVTRRYAPSLGVLVATLFAALALFLTPQPARANVDCANGGARLDFGASLTATGTMTFTCNNYDQVNPITITLCLGIGALPSYPGTVTQPMLLGPGSSTLAFNVYKDAGGAMIWTQNNPFTLQITIAANSAYSGSFTYYGRIAEGQTPIAGSTYNAAFYETTLGFIVSGNPVCQPNPTNLSGRKFNLDITAHPVTTCVFGTSDAVDFGTHARLADNTYATGAVRIICPLNVNWTLHFDGGQNALGTERRMRNGTGSYIPYLLYRDAGHTQQIAIDGTIPGAGTGLTQQVPVYGRIEPRSLPEIGTYSDFVVVILSF